MLLCCLAAAACYLASAAPACKDNPNHESCNSGSLLPVDWIFVPHYSKLTKRRQHLAAQLERENLLEYSEFVQVFDAENITRSLRAEFYTPLVT